MTEQESDALSTTLASAVHAAGAELVPDGWSFVGARTRFLMRTHVPVLEFRRGAETLAFIVTPADPSGRCFKRSKRFDLSYFSEDVGDHEQDGIYRRSREQIERVARWLVRWDA
jgi:hypothetical protein